MSGLGFRGSGIEGSRVFFGFWGGFLRFRGSTTEGFSCVCSLPGSAGSCKRRPRAAAKMESEAGFLRVESFHPSAWGVPFTGDSIP